MNLFFRFAGSAAFICVLSFVFPAYGQNEEFQFTHLTTDDGLSQSNITCITQDSKGFMWFGTFNGLNKYNGYDFEVFNYHFDDSNSISHNYISAILEAHNGYLWVGSGDGLNRYDRQTNRFKSFRHQKDNPSSISDNQVEAILEDRRKRLWIATRNGGLDLFNSQTESFINHSAPVVAHEGGDFVRVLFEDSAENLWVANRDGSINILNANRDETEPLLIAGENLTEYPVTAIVESLDKNIWIATQGDGIYRLNYEKGKTSIRTHYKNNPQNKNSLRSSIILSMLLDSSNKLWIGHEDSGIAILDIDRDSFQFVSHDPLRQSSLNHNSIWSIFEDNAGSFWIGTYAHGLNFLNTQKALFQHFKHNPGIKNNLSHNMVNSFVEDEKGELWIATDGGGLNVYNRQRDRFSGYNSKNSSLRTDIILDLFIDSRKRFWLATWSDGLYQFDRAKGNFIHYSKEKNGLGSDRILSIDEDKKGGLWLATFWGGLTYFHPEKNIAQVFNSQNSALSDDDVRVVKQDFNGELWIGTNIGLDHFNPATKTFSNYRHIESDTASISKGFVQSIMQAQDSSIWVGTATGFNRFDKKSANFIHYNSNQEWRDEEIKAIIEDDDNILWLSTNKGISRFDPRTGIFKNFNYTDGLQGNEFNSRSAIKMSDGEIAFGGNSGYNVFRPAAMQNNTFIPPLFITDFKIFNKQVEIGGEIIASHISEAKEIFLSYDQTVFSFEFAALNYVSSSKNQYAYKMEGFDSEWNYIGTKRTASYTNLAAGNYIFKVKAANNDGLWNEKATSLKITINPPFWKTWWAYLLEALIIIFLIGFVINYYFSRQRLTNALKIEHLELTKMYELDQMKTRFFGNIAHEFRSPMTLILGPLEKLLSSAQLNGHLKSSLSLIYRNAKRMQRMTDQLKDVPKIDTGELLLELSLGDIVSFVEEIAESFKEYALDQRIGFHIKTEIETLTSWFDRDKLDKIIYNLLSNAFKFTPAEGNISLRISTVIADKEQKIIKQKEKGLRHIQIIIEDNGIGIAKDSLDDIFKRHYQIEDFEGRHHKGSGLGLAFVNELLKVYHGKIEVDSTEGAGSKFTVLIPLDEHYLEENQLVKKFIGAPLNDTTGSKAAEFFQTELPLKDTATEDIPSLLIAEDDAEIRDYLKDSLEKKYRLILVSDGKEGLKKALEIIPDLIISDIKMPVVDGIQMCNQLREDEKTSHIPIVLLSGYSSKKYKIEGLKQGADAYVSKPFNIDELQAQIENLLESRKKLRKKFNNEILFAARKEPVKNIDEKFIQRVMQIIEDNISDSSFNAESLSKNLAMSRMQLYRKLRGLTDQTVHEFIRTIRLRKAARHLEDKSMTITEAAYEVGFNDLTYFARCFRKLYDKSPSEYLAAKK